MIQIWHNLFDVPFSNICQQNWANPGQQHIESLMGVTIWIYLFARRRSRRTQMTGAQEQDDFE
jgi:hypothetical protein